VEARGPFDPEKATWYSEADRAEQLRRFGEGCAALAALYDEQDIDLARTYRSLNRVAASLGHGVAPQGELNALSAALPERPMWLHPKAADYQMPRQPWQDEVAELREMVEQTAVELRSLATY